MKKIIIITIGVILLVIGSIITVKVLKPYEVIGTYKCSQLENVKYSIDGYPQKFLTNDNDLYVLSDKLFSDNTNCNHDKYYYWEPGKYDEYNDLYTDWEANDLKPAQEAYDNAVKEFNELFAGEDETLIDFYDAIFSSIAA